MEAIFQVQQQLKRELGWSKVKVIRNANYKPHGTKSYVHLLNKYGFETTKPGPYHVVNKVTQRGLAPANFTAAVGGRVRLEKLLVKKKKHGAGGSTTTPGHAAPAGQETGQVTAEDQQNDSEYLAQVQIGTPPQTFLLDFDTGSADLWVFSTELKKSLQSNHTDFNAAKSSTFQKSANQLWKITYGDGSSASGDVGTDVVSIGGVVIQNQAIEQATQLSAQFSSGTGDGLLGLAWPSINTITTDSAPTPQNTPVANLIAANELPPEAQLFTSAFYSTRDASASSFYTFGYIDQDLVAASGAEIAWTPIDNSEGFWMFDSTTTTINGKAISQPGNTAIADTGTTLALVSDAVCDALYKQIPGAKYDSNQQGYVFPNTVTTDQLPTLAIAVGNTQFTVQPEDLAFAPGDDNTWYGGVQSRGQNPFDILGDAFLKSVYVIWDQGNTRIGLVPKIQATQNLDPSQ